MKMRFFSRLSAFDERYLNCIKFVVNKQRCLCSFLSKTGANQMKYRPKQSGKKLMNITGDSKYWIAIDVKGFPINRNQQWERNANQHVTTYIDRQTQKTLTYLPIDVIRLIFPVQLFFSLFQRLTFVVTQWWAQTASNHLIQFEWRNGKQIGELSV